MINSAIYASKFGMFKISYENDAIVSLKNIQDNTADDYGMKTELTDTVFEQLMEYFEGKRKNFSFPYKLRGTVFQKKVWSALCQIPYGETRSYKEIAVAVGNEKASRAVGMANNKNPIAIAIPCHRVIGSSGKLVGYAGGLEMKQCLLNLEKKNMVT